MPIPELDRVALARAWIEFIATLNPDSGSISEPEYAALACDEDWAVDLLSRYAESDPEGAYQVILEIVSISQDPWILTNIGAGPLETILWRHAPEFVPRLTRDAVEFPILRALPPHVWISEMPEHLRRELDALAGSTQS
jgi:hypothetical protein